MYLSVVTASKCSYHHFRNACRSRGFGFVTYKKAHMVDDAQRERPHKIDKKEVESKRAMPREVDL